jgi:hypothetical protein
VGGIPLARRAPELKFDVSGCGAVSDYLPLLVFLYGSFAGFLIFRLGRNNELRAGEERVLVAAGWTMTALSLTLAAALMVFVISQNLAPAIS